MSLSKNRIQTGGWARQQNCNHRLFVTVTSISHLLFPAAVMPIATSMAGVNMRLEAGAIRYALLSLNRWLRLNIT